MKSRNSMFCIAVKNLGTTPLMKYFRLDISSFWEIESVTCFPWDNYQDVRHYFSTLTGLMCCSMSYVQVNLCQKHSFLNQLTHNMTTDCSLITYWLHSSVQEKYKIWWCCVQTLFWMPKQKQKTIFVHNMFSTCIFLVLKSVINEQ